ncbi:hypothetical protein [Parvularcula sp. IMCC14364]|uniref:hypothetical protein n=1 Tax=Parvularcula sp. IMCC14364 TaxID=3067902 RepID=UPI0027425638|nr:hypothetical protein [Parvularcula sp. IMCC14364]
METLELARHFVRQLEDGSIDGARGCLDANAEIWHDFDNKTQTADENMALFFWLVSKTKKRQYEITRLEAITGGYLQQHTLKLTTLSGQELTAYACCIVRVEKTKIVRIEEYINNTPLTALSD